MKFVALIMVLAFTHVRAEPSSNQFSVARDGEFVVLENGRNIRAVIAPERGGELSGFSVLINEQWHELLYRAQDYSDQPGWRGKAQLLWPATGISLAESGQAGTYQLGEEAYKIPFHGFARLESWNILDQNQTVESASVTLQMKDTEGTRRYYPFGFTLQVEYRLGDSGLSVLYRVDADSGNDLDMPFSIGNHITFNAPLITGTEPAELRFENDFPQLLIRRADKTFTGSTSPSPFRGVHGLAELPKRGAVSLGGQQGRMELTIHDPSGLSLRLAHQASSPPTQPAVQFNLWADAEQGFFSPEPWVGTQNSLNNGMGLVRLSPGQTWYWQIDIVPEREWP
jgi:galactose mutarotase-like enzyme